MSAPTACLPSANIVRPAPIALPTTITPAAPACDARLRFRACWCAGSSPPKCATSSCAANTTPTAVHCASSKTKPAACCVRNPSPWMPSSPCPSRRNACDSVASTRRSTRRTPLRRRLAYRSSPKASSPKRGDRHNRVFVPTPHDPRRLCCAWRTATAAVARR